MADDPLTSYPAMMSPDQVAEYLGTSAERLQQWRHKEIGPPWTKVTPGPRGLVRYPREDLRAYLRARTSPTAHAAQEPAHNEPVTA
jgi:hypothetical protein